MDDVLNKITQQNKFASIQVNKVRSPQPQTIKLRDGLDEVPETEKERKNNYMVSILKN